MRVLFAGTPDIAVPSLRLLAARHDVAAVLTAPDKIRGRGRQSSPSPVKTAALELGVPVLQPLRLGAEARQDVERMNADLLVVYAYGRIFGPKFLGLFPQGGINLHPSALPKYRGPAPITAAILAGDAETALSVQRVALEMDAGDLLLQRPLLLSGRETTDSLTNRVALESPPVLLEAVDGLDSGGIESVPQDHEKASYCRLIAKGDGVVDWNRSAEELERIIRAYQPWPKASSTLNGEGLFLLEASVVEGPGFDAGPGTVLGVDKSKGILVQTGKGALALTRLQLASRKPLDHRSFVNGVSLQAGTILGDPA